MNSKKYKIIECLSLEDLEIEVCKSMEFGWVPQGGLVYHCEKTTYRNERKGTIDTDEEEFWRQALIKK